MFLRYIVTNWLQGQAKQVVQSSVTDYLAKGSSEPSEDQPEIESVDVAIIMALGIEAGGFYDLLQDPITIQGAGFKEHVGHLGENLISLVESGAGQKAAAQATQLILQSRTPRYVLSAGFAGGLHEEVRKGHIVMANQSQTADAESIDIPVNFSEEQLTQQKGLHVGKLLTVNKIVSAVKEKHTLGEKHRAIAVDMETAAVVKVCLEHQTPLISVRVITDGVNDQLPPHLERMLNQKNTSRMLGAAAAALFKNPGSVKEMWNLRDIALKASDRLARFLSGIVGQL